MELKFGDDVDVDCLCRNHASWHKSCHLKFSLSKLKKALERADRKRRDDSREDEEERPTPKCRKRQSVSEERSQCLFCLGGDDGDKLHCFSVLETELFELSSLYIQRLEDVGIKRTINKTRLKIALLEHYNGTLQEQTDGRNTVLVFREAISSLLKDALKQRDSS